MSLSKTFENYKSKIILISGSSNKPLSESISKYLDIPLAKVIIRRFHNTELDPQVLNNIRGKHVFIIQTGSPCATGSVNDMYMELLLLVGACKGSSGKKITAIMPNYPYARSDKKTVPRSCIGAGTVCRCLVNEGCERIISMDLHSAQIQGFTNIPFDNLYAIKVFCEVLQNKYLTDDNKDNYILVAPDNGALKRIKAYSKCLNLPYVTVNKDRDPVNISTINEVVVTGSKELLPGRCAIIVDDIVDTMGTVIAVVTDLLNYGITKAIVIATHGILSGPAIDRINDCTFIESIMVTNTISQEKNMSVCPKIISVDVGHIFGEVIKRIVTGDSISELFNE